MKTSAYLALAAMGAFILPSCETTTSASGTGSEWKRPPRYGSGSQSGNSSRGSNRFGYSGNNSDRSTSNSDRNSNSDTADKPKPKPKKEEEKKPASSGSDSKLKYAVKVPGKPLEVKLPGVSAPISIEKYDSAGKPTGEPLPPGTAVEIPDPNGGGGKIQFLVP